jgi:hypothetical protein
MQTITLSNEVIESLLHAQQSVEVWLASLDAVLAERKRYDRGFAPQVRLRNRLRVFRQNLQAQIDYAHTLESEAN